MAVSLQKYGVNHWINHLYYLTPFDNLKSIADHGLFSRKQMRELGMEHRDIADPDVWTSAKTGQCARAERPSTPMCRCTSTRKIRC